MRTETTKKTFTFISHGATGFASCSCLFAPFLYLLISMTLDKTASLTQAQHHLTDSLLVSLFQIPKEEKMIELNSLWLVFSGLSVYSWSIKVSVPDSSAYSLKDLEPAILSGAGKMCLRWRSPQTEAYEEIYSHALNLLFWINICSCLRIRRANITRSKGCFLDWSVAQYHILRCWEEKEQLGRYQRQLPGACFLDFMIKCRKLGM